MSENFQFLKEGLIADLVGRLMSDYNFDMEKALDIVYSSDTIQKQSKTFNRTFKKTAGRF